MILLTEVSHCIKVTNFLLRFAKGPGEPNPFIVLFTEEVEEQLTLLLKLVPEWISEKKLAPGGDLLLI